MTLSYQDDTWNEAVGSELNRLGNPALEALTSLSDILITCTLRWLKMTEPWRTIRTAEKTTRMQTLSGYLMFSNICLISGFLFVSQKTYQNLTKNKKTNSHWFITKWPSLNFVFSNSVFRYSHKSQEVCMFCNSNPYKCFIFCSLLYMSKK